MKQAILILFNKNWNKELEEIRKKYVEYSKKINPHISLIYPFKIENQNELKNHILKTTKKFNSFEIELNKFGKSKNEYYLYLLPKNENEQLLKLHNSLQSGILANTKNEEMGKYIPHITLGVFNTEKEINSALDKCKNSNLSYKTKVDKIQLITFDDEYNIVKSDEFSLENC